MIKSTLFALYVCCLTLTAGAAEEPKWLKDARAREAKDSAPREVKSKDAWLKAKIPAKVVGVIEKVEESYSIELSIGADSSIYCEVVPGGFDIGDMLRRTQEGSLKAIESEQGKIDFRTLDTMEGGALGNSPYLMPAWMYRVDNGKEKRMGGLRQFALLKNGHGVYCALAEIGYARTFAAVANAFANTLEVADKDPAPYYQEIATMSLNGQQMGVSFDTLVRDADGDTKAVVTTAMLMPVPNGVVHSQDGVHVEWINGDGGMINATYVDVVDGDIKTNVTLKPKDDRWIIDGEMNGKKLNETLPADAHPGTWVAQALDLRKLMAADKPVGAEHNMSMWMSDDPTKLRNVNTKLLAKVDEKGYSAVSTIPGMTLNLTLDKASGMASTTIMQLAGQTVKVQRVYVSGAF